MGVKDVLKDNKKFLLLVLLLLVVCIAAVAFMNSGFYTGSNLGLNKATYIEPNDVLEKNVDYGLNIKTIYGDIVVDLFEDDAPKNVNSLLFLVGEDYYAGLTFYKVANNFIIQAGDTTGTGNGNPGYDVPLENTKSEFEDYSVGMANASQFFIVLPGSDKSQFDGKYSLVGKVTSGFVVVDSIAKVEVDDNYKPINDVKINSIQILEN